MSTFGALREAFAKREGRRQERDAPPVVCLHSASGRERVQHPSTTDAPVAHAQPRCDDLSFGRRKQPLRRFQTSPRTPPDPDAEASKLDLPRNPIGSRTARAPAVRPSGSGTDTNARMSICTRVLPCPPREPLSTLHSGLVPRG